MNAIEWLENKTRTELFELEKTSDPQIVADYITGLVTVLNQVCLLFSRKEITVFFNYYKGLIINIELHHTINNNSIRD